MVDIWPRSWAIWVTGKSRAHYNKLWRKQLLLPALALVLLPPPLPKAQFAANCRPSNMCVSPARGAPLGPGTAHHGNAVNLLPGPVTPWASPHWQRCEPAAWTRPAVRRMLSETDSWAHPSYSKAYDRLRVCGTSSEVRVSSLMAGGRLPHARIVRNAHEQKQENGVRIWLWLKSSTHWLVQHILQ